MAHAGLRKLNNLSHEDALKALGRCCGSRTWIAKMESARPFENRDHLMEASAATFRSLTRSDWLEAFAQHPPIGDQRAVDRSSESEWSSREQSSTRQAARDDLELLAELNDRYANRFGYTYIVCATGLETREMVADLTSRLENDPDNELAIAADHQERITKLRLEKLLDSLT